MPKIATAVEFTKVVPITFTTPMGMQEVRCFEAGEIVEISDTGASQGGNYIPVQAAAQIIASGFRTPVYGKEKTIIVGAQIGSRN